MAEQTVVDRRRSVVVPADSDPVALAAAMNPAMSSWIALRRRIEFLPGSRVLVLGAGGNAGRLAWRSPCISARARRSAPPATRGRGLVALEDVDPDVDVVLDYLWGEPTAAAIRTIVTRRTDRARPLDWIQIGSVAGPDLVLPSAALRAANLRLLGSGQGSVSTAGIVEELPALAAEIGAFAIDAVAVPLSEVETAWNAPGRVVFVPR